MYAAFGTTTAIQAHCQNLNRGRAYWQWRKTIIILLHAFYYEVCILGILSHKKSWNLTSPHSNLLEDSNKGIDPKHVKSHML